MSRQLEADSPRLALLAQLILYYLSNDSLASLGLERRSCLLRHSARSKVDPLPRRPRYLQFPAAFCRSAQSSPRLMCLLLMRLCGVCQTRLCKICPVNVRWRPVQSTHKEPRGAVVEERFAPASSLAPRYIWPGGSILLLQLSNSPRPGPPRLDVPGQRNAQHSA